MAQSDSRHFTEENSITETRNKYLMQFQSDILQARVSVPGAEELSGIGAAYMAGLALGIWSEDVFTRISSSVYHRGMDAMERDAKYAGWKLAVNSVLGQEK